MQFARLFTVLALSLGAAPPSWAGSFFSPAATESHGVRDPRPALTISSNCVGSDTANTTTVNCTLADLPAGGTAVVLAGKGVGGSVVSVADGTNTYTLLVAGSGSTDVEIWYCLNPAHVSAGGTLTVTFDGAAVVKYVHVLTLNRIASTDTTGSDTGVSNAPSCTSGSMVSGAAAFGIVVANPSGATGTQPGSFAGAVQGPVGAASFIDGSFVTGSAGAQTYNPTGFGVVVWACAVGSFK